MAFEPVFEVTKLDSLRRLCSSQAVVEARLLPSSSAAIARVLSIATDCSVSPSEVFAGEARYNGRVRFKVIYVDMDGKNHSLDYNADFTDKITSDVINAGIKPIISASILDTDIVNADEREIKLACVLEVYLDAVVSESANILVKGGDGVYTHDDKMDYLRLSGEGNAAFEINDEIKGAKITGVLLSEPKLFISKVRANTESVTVEGKIICDIACEGEDGMISSHSTTAAFTEEVPTPGCTEACLAFASATLTNFKSSFESDGEGNAIILSYNVNVSVRSFAEVQISPTVDAFSVTNELLQAGESLKVCKNKERQVVPERVDGSVTLDINMPAADNVLAVTGSKINIANAGVRQGRVVLEGIVSASIIYYSADTNSKNSVAVELPFSLNTNVSASEGDEISAKGIVAKTVTKIRRGNEIDIKCDVEVEITTSITETKYIITELKLGELRALPTSAFSIHIARSGESLWDVAKALGSTPEVILMQNANLTLPLAGGERVIVYRNLK